MSAADLAAVLPIVVLAAAAVAVMLAAAIHRSHGLALWMTLASLVLAGASLPLAASEQPRRVATLLTVDGYSLFFTGLILAATFAVAVLSYAYFSRRPGNHEELYLMLLLAALGAVVLTGSRHFASLFLGLEILSASLYVLVAFPRGRRNIEAAVKYLILAAVSAALLLFGMALVYADLASMDFDRIAAASAPAGTGDLLLAAGLVLLFAGLAFKLALVPLHMWTPDVYQGAPPPVAAFIATVSKAAVFALLLRFFHPLAIQSHANLYVAFATVAVASMFAGNFLALLQNDVKRLLAYSSIAQLGYLLVAFLAGGPLAVTAVSFFLVAYTATMLGAFGIVTLMSERREAGSLENYSGLFWRRPWLAAVMAAMMFSLAGIPLTAGFIGKFYVLDAGVGSSLWLLSASLVASSAIGLYYYLRVIVVMYRRPLAAGGHSRTRPPLRPLAGGLVLALVLLIVLWLGVYPGPLIEIIQKTAILN